MNTNKKYFTIKELKKKYTYYQIKEYEKKSSLKKINRSTYLNNSFNGDDNELFIVNAYVRTGVICLMSAAVYHELTNYRPFQINVAVERDTKIRIMPEYPMINIVYFSRKRHDIGIVNIKEKGGSYRVYDVEKTVCDIIYYRKKIGIEETKEVISNYLNKTDRNLNKLVEYAKELNIYTILKTYMEVLVWKVSSQ